MIKSQNLCFTYSTGEQSNFVLQDISLKISKGEFVAILGRNGSGKSTLARHFNALLAPTSGTLWINGLDTSKTENTWQVRQATGMVFQNPDNQIVATLVEDDVAFGPENLGVCPKEIAHRVDVHLKAVGMDEYRKTPPHNLSGGQKQRVAIAGVLAMMPSCIVLDEATAMLDPLGRSEVIETVKRLNREESITVILITHFMEEALVADRVIVMSDGKVELDAQPKDVFSDSKKIKSLGLNVPSITELCSRLSIHGIYCGIVSEEEFVADEAVKKILLVKEQASTTNDSDMPSREVAVKLSNLTHTYSAGSVFEKNAINGVSLEIYRGEIAAIIGHTGSGKSTLVQHLNALLAPTVGTVYVDSENIHADKARLKSFRQKVGIVFQYPEHQLFESTVLRDVCFGPRQMSMDAREAEVCAREALEAVGIQEELFGKSPFELSGGQKRRVAIAGVLAMRPGILVLDEPTAGLDPCGKDEILSHIMKLHKSKNITVILVSHSMDDVALHASRIFVMNRGRLHLSGTPKEVFMEREMLAKIGLDVPKINKLFLRLNSINPNFPKDVLTIDEAEAVFNRLFEVKS